MSKIIMEMDFDRSPLSMSIYLTELNNQGIYLLIILLYYTTSILLHLASFECTVKLKKCVHGAAALRTERERCRKKLLKNNIRSSADVVEALTEPLIVLPLFFFASISVTVRLQPLINHAVCV